ncbi:hypothetical protein RHMOL_Rhmol01G0284600 [Rhododendron molle]|uniref:Uncharacterized protein n=1 Tax=Rhododendron molle TaxID=49168 RepID=A0ACC0Q7V6_RHOML|nr:hypothetical protein RHMOL_Rhmol01G0284600 [Rhododendron molle]
MHTNREEDNGRRKRSGRSFILAEDSSLPIFFASSPVQHECIPQAILGMDVICQAMSGMGKTAVFVLSTLQQIEPVAGQVAALVLLSYKGIGVPGTSWTLEAIPMHPVWKYCNDKKAFLHSCIYVRVGTCIVVYDFVCRLIIILYFYRSASSLRGVQYLFA